MSEGYQYYNGVIWPKPTMTLSRGGALRELIFYKLPTSKGVNLLASRADDLSFSLVAHTPSANRGRIETLESSVGGVCHE